MGRDVLDVLDAMRRSGNQGVKQDWLQSLLAEKCSARITSREPNLPQKDVVARSKAIAARIVDALGQRGILITDGYNPSGLKKGITTRLSQHGIAMLERMQPKTIPDLDDVDTLIATEYPDGDVRTLAVCIMEAIVRVFRDLQSKDGLDKHRALFDECHTHAGQLETALDADEIDAIKQALELVVKDYRRVKKIGMQ